MIRLGKLPDKFIWFELNYVCCYSSSTTRVSLSNQPIIRSNNIKVYFERIDLIIKDIAIYCERKGGQAFLSLCFNSSIIRGFVAEKLMQGLFPIKNVSKWFSLANKSVPTLEI